MISYPVIDQEKCTVCGQCVKSCVTNAMSMKDNVLSFEIENCFSCSHCSAVCPTEAISFNNQTGNKLHPLDTKSPEILERIVSGRRSMRNYQNKELPDEVIEKIMNVANQSPTGKNNRMVSVTVISGYNKMNEFSDIAMKFFRSLIYLANNPILKPFVLLFGGTKAIRNFKKYKNHINKYFEGKNILTHDAPAIFVFHASQKSACPSQDAVIWATTASLYAESLGLGTCYNGFLVGGININKKLKKYLGIPKENKVYETFTIGYPSLKYLRTAYRDQPNYKLIK